MSVALRVLRRALSIRRGDLPLLRHLAPLFALTGAGAIATASYSKSVFLGHNPYSALPWAVLGMSGFTALASVLYAALIDRWAVRSRFAGLLMMAALSFVGVALALPLQPRALSMVTLVWCIGLGNLLLMQTWNYSTVLSPVRQARRLFPLLAAAATAGAAVGGMLTRALLPLGLLQWLPHLIAGVWMVELVVLARAPAELRAAAALPPRTDGKKRTPLYVTALKGWRAVRSSALLRRLAALAFFLQAAATLLDYQFLAGLKQAYDTQGMAGFLGTYYGLANLLSVLLALGLGRRVARAIPLGLATGLTAALLGLGGAVLTVMHFANLPGLLWVVFATSFQERVLSYSVARHAFQAAFTPVDPEQAEAAKLWIEGLGQRVAGVGVSLALLLVAADLSAVGSLAAPMLLAAGLALAFALGLGRAYRSELFERLRTRSLEGPGSATADEAWLQRELRRGFQPLLAADSAEELIATLDVLLELRSTLRAADLLSVLRHEDPEVVLRGLRLHRRLELPAPPALVERLLRPDSPAALLREALQLVPWEAPPSTAALVTRLSDSSDPTVAFLACRWQRRHARCLGLSATGAFAAEGSGTLAGEQSAQRRGLDPSVAARLTQGQGATGEPPSVLPTQPIQPVAAVLLAGLGSSERSARLDAIDAMGGLCFEQFVLPLLATLREATLRPAIHRALRGFDPGMVMRGLRQVFRGPAGGAAQLKAQLLQLATGLDHEGVPALALEALGGDSLTLRNQAAQCLWRFAGRHPHHLLPTADIVQQLTIERDGLFALLFLDSTLGNHAGERFGLLRHEVRLLRSEGEQRAFHLLGALYPGGAVERAEHFYRSPDRRERSNAIDLLDTTVTEPRLRALVAYLETAGGGAAAHSGSTRSTLATHQGAHELSGLRELSAAAAAARSDPSAMLRMIPSGQDWLRSLTCWCLGPTQASATTQGEPAPPCGATRTGGTMPEESGPMSQDRMQRLLSLRGIPLFDGLRAELLLPLAEVAEELTLEGHAVVVRQGDPGAHLYLLLAGQVVVERDGQAVAHLGPGECFGELSILDPGPRSATVRATRATTCLRIAREDFQALLELSPSLAAGVMQVLAKRLRLALPAAPVAPAREHSEGLG